ncbi:uncharacterized protein LY79DRAFT_558451 [Colletotrichum navitas]|uniref:BTB domain-containing protein n=1 Tax=Colletotrichum navitas TaxID=681940 RepID=A0AAD8PXI3_9PEZI|nr:uncharacterized protein LY79DRAFT_558451 [Colletotrichum navitas]KAK1585603.1 hypothetical protein LY79DRAFT_558451 [Colletotrichum navitas]
MTSSIFKSRQVAFLIGPNKVEFNVHQYAFTRLSAPLRAMLADDAKESVEFGWIWDDVEPSTFTSLLEYAYTDNYSVPRLHKKKPVATAAVVLPNQTDQEEAVDEEDRWSVSSIMTWMMDNDDRFGDCTRFGKWCYGRKHFETDFPGPQPYWHDELQRSDCTGLATIFMLHVKLYALADRYRFISLRALCLQRLRESLVNVVLRAEFCEALVEMLAFAYANTPPGDDLRMMLLRYCIFQMNHLKRHGYLHQLVLEMPPQFAAELLLEVPQGFWESAL